MTTTRARKPRTTPEPPPEALVMAPTTATPAPAERTYALVPVGALMPSANNPRRDLGDLDGLAASIRSVGIQEPLLVEWSEPSAPYVILAGHRRLAAARIAGLAEVPCLVRRKASTPAERMEIALVENLQREDLSPLDEARGYAELVRLGLSQRAIAERVGCSQPQVSKRLALLELPSPVQARVAKGTLPLEAAAALVRLKDHPDKLKAAAGEDPSAIVRAVERAEADIAWEAKRSELCAIAKGRGWDVVDEPANGYGNRPWKTLARWQYAEAELVLDVRKHESEPCHAVMIPGDRRWPHLEAPSATSICTEPARHGPKGASKLKAKVPAQPKGPAQDPAWAKLQEERRKAEAERQVAATARRAVLAKGVAEHKAPRSTSPALALTLRAVLRWAAEFDLDEAACGLLGLELGDDNEAYPLEDYAAAGTDHLHRAALAVTVAEVEGDLRYGSFAGDRVAAHFAWLAELGYEPSPFEAAELARARAAGGDSAGITP